MTQLAINPNDMLGHARPPNFWDRLVNNATRLMAASFAVGAILLLLYILYTIGWITLPVAKSHGLEYLSQSTYDAEHKVFNPDSGEYDLPAPQYGLLPAMLGTLYSSLLALVIASIFGVAIAIFLSQDFIPKKLEIIFKNIVELLAAIPSVVYGLWGIVVMLPLLRPLCDFFSAHFGWITFFHGHLSAAGLLPAALVLAIMVIPTISAISYDALSSVHPRLKEGAMGLGATKWEMILKVILPTASTGVFGAIVLGFGRALGETMALLMLMGSVNHFSWSLFAPGNTLAALIAGNYPEADDDQIKVLLFAGMVLLTITLVVNVIGAAVIQYANRGRKGAVQ